MIDTNVSLGPWPFRKLPVDTAGALAERLRRAGTTQAWVGSLEGPFHRDVEGVNARLAEACRNADAARLLPFGTVNVALPDWEEDLRRCHETHKFRGIRLHPAYHGYLLSDPRCVKLLELAAARGLLVQIAVTMEDERTQHPVFRVPAVDTLPLETIVPKIQGLRLVILNAFRAVTIDAAARLAPAGAVWFDIAMLEGVDRLTVLVEKLGPDRILFGSHYPLFHLESAALKLRESKQPAKVLAQVSETNAQKLIT